MHSGSLKDLSQRLENHELDVVLSNVLPSAKADTNWSPNRIASQEVSLIGTPERINNCKDLVELLTQHPVVLPPIFIKDELNSGQLIEAVQIPGLTETFYALTLKRRFPNPLLQSLLTQNFP